MPPASSDHRASPVHVAAAVLTDASGRVLISRRAADAHQGGLWEFPGGKLDAGESAETALRRELEEELGVIVEAARPLIRVSHDYPDRSVVLDVWRVTAWRGEPRGREGQEIDWVATDELTGRDFPAADGPVIAALQLPSRYAITPPLCGEPSRFLRKLDRLTAIGGILVQLRDHGLEPERFAALAGAALTVCHGNGVRLLVNAEPDVAAALEADGVHLTSERLKRLSARPLGAGSLVGASCHDADELRHAARIGADFAVLSPVRTTPGHEDVVTLGWAGFAALSQAARLPVYALGSVGPEDLETAWRHGGQGVAGIRAFWPAG